MGGFRGRQRRAHRPVPGQEICVSASRRHETWGSWLGELGAGSQSSYSSSACCLPAGLLSLTLFVFCCWTSDTAAEIELLPPPPLSSTACSTTADGIYIRSLFPDLPIFRGRKVELPEGVHGVVLREQPCPEEVRRENEDLTSYWATETSFRDVMVRTKSLALPLACRGRAFLTFIHLYHQRREPVEYVWAALAEVAPLLLFSRDACTTATSLASRSDPPPPRSPPNLRHFLFGNRSGAMIRFGERVLWIEAWRGWKSPSR